MSDDTRDALGILLAIIVFCCLRIFLRVSTALSLFAALVAGLILVVAYEKWKDYKRHRRTQ